MIPLARGIELNEEEIEWSAMRSSGPGGQHVNKVSTGISLRLSINESTIPEPLKNKLRLHKHHHLTGRGEILIKVQESRSQEKNKELALKKLIQLLNSLIIESKKRKATQPTRGAKERRLGGKKIRGQVKQLRRKVDD